MQMTIRQIVILKVMLMVLSKKESGMKIWIFPNMTSVKLKIQKKY